MYAIRWSMHSVDCLIESNRMRMLNESLSNQVQNWHEIELRLKNTCIKWWSIERNYWCWFTSLMNSLHERQSCWVFNIATSSKKNIEMCLWKMNWWCSWQDITRVISSAKTSKWFIDICFKRWENWCCIICDWCCRFSSVWRQQYERRTRYRHTCD